MGIDINRETLLPLARAVRVFPHGTRASTLFRWITRGVRLRSTGERLRLEAIRCGRKICTSAEAVQRFLDAQSEDLPSSPGQRVRTPAAMQRASELAFKEAEEMGV